MTESNRKNRTKRMSQIMEVFTRYGLADSVKDSTPRRIKDLFVDPDGQLLSQYSQGERLRMALSELGTTFIKFGQMLSTRDDLFGPEILEELKKLQADTPPDPPDLVRSTVEEELGGAVEDLYQTFELEALGSASIGQVHAATLKDGTTVVVKLIHAGIEETVQLDLELMDQAAGLMDLQPDLTFRPSEVIADFRRQLLNELDLQQEQRNLTRFRANFASSPTVKFPQPYPDLSTSRVLTMERLEGISMSDHESLVAEGIDLAGLAKQGADIWFEMIFRDRFYHADPHPGNLLVLPEGVAGILDSGMVDRIDKRMLADLEDLVIAYVNKDVEQIADVAMRICDPPRGFDRKRFEAEIGYIVDDLLDRPVEQIDMVELGNAIIGVIRNFQLNIPSNYFIFIKTVALLEGTSRALDMNFNLAEMLMPYVQEIISRRFSIRNLMQSMLRSYRDWDRMIRLLPAQLADILDQAQTGEFSFNMEVKGLDRIINRLIFGMIATGLILASALMWNAGVGPFFEEFSLLGAAGIVFALYIVYRLWRSINRSGGL